jgi:hypothetical protein
MLEEVGLLLQATDLERQPLDLGLESADALIGAALPTSTPTPALDQPGQRSTKLRVQHHRGERYQQSK